MASAASAIAPKVVSRAEWVDARNALLEKEKEFAAADDALSAQRQAMPAVKVDKKYIFKDKDNKDVTLLDLFQGQKQLIMYHFMFAPDWEEAECAGCVHTADTLPDFRHLRTRNTSLVLVSRAAPKKLEKFRARAGWSIPWYSTVDSDFSWDFNPTFRDKASRFTQEDSQGAENVTWKGDETGTPGFNVFVRNEDEIYHTYTTLHRTVEKVIETFRILELTPLGVQQGLEPPFFKLPSEYEST